MDVEVLMALEDGPRRVASLYAGTKKRFTRAKDLVMARWKELQEASSEVQQARQLQQRLDELESAHVDQRRALEQAQERHAEMARAREASERQGGFIRALEARVREAAAALREGGALEERLAADRERCLQESLRETLAQLELLGGEARGAPRGPSGGREPREPREPRDPAQQRPRRPPPPPDGAEQRQAGPARRRWEERGRWGRELSACRREAGEAADAAAALEARCGELRRRGDALEAEGRERSSAFDRELAELRALLAEREARRRHLERLAALA